MLELNPSQKDDRDKLPKPPSRGEKVDDQNEQADDTGLYDRDEDMYNQDAEVIDNLGEDDEPESDA